MSHKFVYLRADAGEAYGVMGNMFTYLMTGVESGGSFFTLIADVAPHAGPPPHVHQLEEEQFYILDGELTFPLVIKHFKSKLEISCIFLVSWSIRSRTDQNLPGYS